MKTWKLGNLETGKLGNWETWKLGNLETWKLEFGWYDGNFDANFDGKFDGNFDGNLMGHLMMDSKGWPYDSFDCLSLVVAAVVVTSLEYIVPTHNSTLVT